jgi:hypothetical protein
MGELKYRLNNYDNFLIDIMMDKKLIKILIILILNIFWSFQDNIFEHMTEAESPKKKILIQRVNTIKRTLITT